MARTAACSSPAPSEGRLGATPATHKRFLPNFPTKPRNNEPIFISLHRVSVTQGECARRIDAVLARVNKDQIPESGQDKK